MFWKGVWGYLPANIVQGVVGFLTIVLFTRLLSPEDFGRYALAFSVMTLAHVAVFSWLEASMARFWAAESGASLQGHFASLYRTAFGLSVVFLVVIGVGLWLWPTDLLFKTALAVGLAGARPLPDEAGPGAVPRRRRGAQGRRLRHGGVHRRAGHRRRLRPGGRGRRGALLGLGLAPLLALPFVLPGELKEARGGRFEPERMRNYALYGYPIAMSLALTVVLSSTDRFLLAAFMDEAAVGAYHAGYSIANRTLDVLFLWLGSAGQPALVMALERGGADRLKVAAREQLSTFLLVGLPAAAGVALVARPLAEVLIGQDLRAAAASITPWIALSALLYGLTAYYFGQAFTLGRKTKHLLMAMAIPAGANVLLNLILVPRFGVMGAAWATAASFGLGLLATMALGRRVLPLPVPWEALVRCGVAAAVMAAAVSVLPPIGGVFELALDATVGAVVYAAVALTINAAGVRDVALRLVARRRAGKVAA